MATKWPETSSVEVLQERERMKDRSQAAQVRAANRVSLLHYADE